MSTNTLQQQGRDAYKRKDYAKALEYFNRAVGRGDPTVQLLDNRAATHDKLNDLPSALADAKKAIQVGRKEDPTGYLRAGKVLQKMDKASTALEIYAYGLKSIKHVGQGFEQLKKVHDELQAQLAPQHSIDPLTVLPRELAVSVLEYLTFRQRIAVCRVSKGWRQFIKSEPNLWAHLDLHGARKKVRTAFVSVAINCAKKKLKTATLNQLYEFDKVLQALVRYCPLESLTLTGTGLHAQNLLDDLKKADKLKQFRILDGTMIGETTLRESIKLCRQTLEVVQCAQVATLDFGNRWHLDLPNLRILDLTASSLGDVSKAVEQLTQHSPGLQSLTLRQSATRVNSNYRHLDLRGLSTLEYLDLRLAMRTYAELQLPPSLRILKLGTSLGAYSACDFFPDSDNEIEPNGLSLLRLPDLEELELEMPALQVHRVALEFAVQHRDPKETAKLSNLKSLSMYHPGVHPDMFGFGLWLGELERLSLRDCLDINDERMETILNDLKKLRFLNVSGSSITGVGVKDVVKAGHIKELVVNDCQKLGRDAVDWARAQGVKVHFLMRSTETNGKKIRY